MMPTAQPRILATPSANDPDFGKALFHCDDLADWLRQRRLHLTASSALEGYEFVQAAALMATVSTAATLPEDEAREIVDADPQACADLAATADPVAYLQGIAEREWRGVIKAAVASGELALLDRVTGLPVPLLTRSSADSSPEPWESKARAMAAEMYRHNPGTSVEIAKRIAKAFAEMGVLSNINKPLTWMNIHRQTLSPWPYRNT
jgi:hypothetical protein